MTYSLLLDSIFGYPLHFLVCTLYLGHQLALDTEHILDIITYYTERVLSFTFLPPPLTL